MEEATIIITHPFRTQFKQIAYMGIDTNDSRTGNRCIEAYIVLSRKRCNQH